MKSEFDFIEKIRRNARVPNVKMGIGDDCAVISKDWKTDTVISADLLIEDIDFKLNWVIPEFLGHKCLAVSLSDIAAMGGAPVWSLLSIGIPEKIWRTNFVEKFYDGWHALAKKFNVELIGGDISRAPDKIVIDSIVAGQVKKNKAILRSTAKPKDLIFVTGNLGGAAGGLKLLESGEKFTKKSKRQIQNLLLRQLKPAPQIEIGQILAEKNLASSMIDLSDGLSGDLAHLCRESKVGAKIYADKIPQDENLKYFSFPNSPLGKDYDTLSAALNGGEDFELLFTINQKNFFQLEKLSKCFPLSCIGEVTETPDKIELLSNSETRILSSESFRHF